MRTMNQLPRILLIQARSADDPMAQHELRAFADRCELPAEAFRIFNIATDDPHELSFEGLDATMIGGSGDFSLVEGGFDWHQDFLDLMARLMDTAMPTFASCFGFQAIVQTVGGALAKREELAQLGTFEIRLTDAAADDPLFGDLPTTFDAQLGHNDSAVELGDALIHLAESDACPYQAVRVKGRPIVATQFHPELTRSDNIDRFKNYLKNYRKPGQNFEEAMAYAEEIHRPSPHACGLLHSFVNDLKARKAAANPPSVPAE